MIFIWSAPHRYAIRNSIAKTALISSVTVVWAVRAAHGWKGRYSPGYYTPIENAGLYWHLVDIIWIYLFPLLYLISRHS